MLRQRRLASEHLTRTGPPALPGRRHLAPYGEFGWFGEIGEIGAFSPSDRKSVV